MFANIIKLLEIFMHLQPFLSNKLILMAKLLRFMALGLRVTKVSEDYVMLNMLR